MIGQNEPQSSVPSNNSQFSQQPNYPQQPYPQPVQPYPYQGYTQPPPPPPPPPKDSSKILVIVLAVVVVVIIIGSVVGAMVLMNMMRNTVNNMIPDNENDGNNIPTILSPPTNVHAFAGDRYVRLSWDPVPNASSYNIYWGVNPSVSKQTGTKIQNVNNPYNHTGLTNDQTYYYVVTAVNGTRESAESDVVSATPTGQTYAGGPIIIQSDEEFTPAKGVVRGSGTQADPYIIEGWNIDASTANTSEYPFVKVGISISQTTAHFVIRSCYIHSAGAYGFGISLGNLKNGKIENCMITNCSSGISIERCTNLTINGNSISMCEEGISLGGSGYSSENVHITNNSIQSCTSMGIYFHYLYDSTAEHNQIVNTVKGIHVSDCKNCTIAYNEITGMSFAGISVQASLYGFGNNTIAHNNVCQNQGDGIAIYCDNNTIAYNNCSFNTGCGIILDWVSGGLEASYNMVIGNVVNNNIQDGIHVGAYCTANTIKNNTCMGNNANNQHYDDGTPYYYDIYIDELGNAVEGNSYGTIYIKSNPALMLFLREEETRKS
ncbi:MAG: right-handed parallel beta-helix repeat-containing protein [Thermoplasmata archaeon]